ncbi:uncharacterized protein [Ptychodera flava]|uniref:uncharacterized protein n=1 Tax=Ptychodera flava TaxID=63121 RepID=UPI00396A7C20
MGKFTIVSWLQEQIEESYMGSVRGDELWSKCEQTIECSVSHRAALGKIVKKIFPNIVVSGTRDKTTKKRIKMYRGIAWKLSSPQDSNVSLQDLRQYIPDNAVILPRCSSDCVEFAVLSEMTSNGNMVLKQVAVYRDHWELKVRGKKIDLSTMDIDSRICTLSKLTVPDIASLVERVKVCRGTVAETITRRDPKWYPRKCFRELIHITGAEEGVSQEMVRCLDCLQVIHWNAIGGVCRTCQKRCRPYHIETKLWEES